LFEFIRESNEKFLTEEFRFTPHITIFKEGRKKKKYKKKKSKKPKETQLSVSDLSEFWEQFENVSFGEQMIEQIELLQMQSTHFPLPLSHTQLGSFYFSLLSLV
jgi:2'-5' RNA ligase